MVPGIQEKITVSVVAGVDGVDRIALQHGDGSETLLLNLTPSQARLLANELVAAVNKVAVKANLKSGPNMWRQNPGDSQPRLARAGV
ncbi:MAG: hypothetical protein AB1421_13340 [Pseudomonadota bacterium]